MQQLSEVEFDQQFTVVPDAQGDAVRPQADRIGYILTEEAWGQETEALWYEASDDDAGDDSPSSIEAAA